MLIKDIEERKNNKIISVIVPVYKVEQYLPKCIESIINQTYRNLEIILVDDGSPDGCGEICDTYSHKDERIKVFHTTNGGLSAARNFGITKARGEYIGFVDSDDWIEPTMYEVLLNQIEDKQADIAICGYCYEYPKRKVIISTTDDIYEGELNLVRALAYGNISKGAWNKLYRRTCFANIEFPEGHVYEDVTVLCKLFSETASSAVSCSKTLYHYRQRRDSITQKRSGYLVDYWLAYKSRYDYLKLKRPFNQDTELMESLFYDCVTAVARTWRGYYAMSEEEHIKSSFQIEEMARFSQQFIPLFGKPGWPLHLRFSVFWTKFQNRGVFFMLYYLNSLYWWLRRKQGADELY